MIASSTAPIAERLEDALKRKDADLLGLLLLGNREELKEMPVLAKKSMIVDAVQAPIKEAARKGDKAAVESSLRCLKELLKSPVLLQSAQAINKLAPLGVQAILAVDLASSNRRPSEILATPPEEKDDEDAEAKRTKKEASTAAELVVHDAVCSVLDCLHDGAGLDLSSSGSVYKEPPIVLSVSRSLYGVTSHLVKKFKADPNAIVFGGPSRGITSPLLVVCDRGDVPMMRLLLSLGLSVTRFISGKAADAPSGSGDDLSASAPVDPTVSSGNVRVLRGVLFDPPMPFLSPSSPAAARAAADKEAAKLAEQRLEVLQVAIEAEPSCLLARSPGEGMTLAHQAAWSGNERALEMMIKMGGQAAVDQIDAAGDSPLFIAVMRGHKGTAKLLVEKGGAAVPTEEEAKKDETGKVAAIKRKLEAALAK